MLAFKQETPISLEEYFAGEKVSPIKHEYVDGVVYPMNGTSAGASENHNLLSGNCYTVLRIHLKKSPCKPFMADMQVKVDESTVYYPDVMVACDPAPASGGDVYYKTQARVIIEVLSPSTERIDRHEKLLSYKNLKSLQEYVLISQDRMRVELYRKTDAGWLFELYTKPSEDLPLPSLDFKMSLEQIYEEVSFQTVENKPS